MEPASGIHHSPEGPTRGGRILQTPAGTRPTPHPRPSLGGQAKGVAPVHTVSCHQINKQAKALSLKNKTGHQPVSSNHQVSSTQPLGLVPEMQQSHKPVASPVGVGTWGRLSGLLPSGPELPQITNGSLRKAARAAGPLVLVGWASRWGEAGGGYFSKSRNRAL